MKSFLKTFFAITIVFLCQDSLFAAKSLDEIARENEASKSETESTETGRSESKPSKFGYFSESYDFQEEIIGLIAPFEAEKIEASELMKANPKNVELFEAAVSAEKEKDIMQNPQKVVKAWINVKMNQKRNPFIQIAEKRLSEWADCMEKLDAHHESFEKVKKLVTSSVISVDQKKDAIKAHLDEFGFAFGVQEVFNLVRSTKNAELDSALKDTSFQMGIKNIKQERCNKNSPKDCFDLTQLTQDNKEQIFYLEKACSLNYKPGCDEKKKIEDAVKAEEKRKAIEEERRIAEEQRKIKMEQKRKEEEEKRRIAEEQRKLEEQKYKESKEQRASLEQELNRAGRKKRIKMATGFLVPGIVLLGASGVLFYEMTDSQKWYDECSENSQYASYIDDIERYERKMDKAKKQVTAFKISGSVAVVLGAAMVTTGIVLYSIDFKSEKEVKKKYNVSFGAQPSNGSLYLTLNW